MKIKLFLVSILILGALPLKAGLYNCDTPEGKPYALPSVGESKLTFETKAPYFKPYHLDDDHHKNKTPFLIYYAVDSSEAFMQFSVRFEIGKLQESCAQSPSVNFVAFLNSLYVDKNQFIICKNKQIRYVDISKFPALNDSLKSKRKFISTGDHTEDNLGPLTYRVRYLVHTNEPFGRYPLAHPDFLYDLINFAVSEDELFPSNIYIPFLNLKSHGSDNRVLAGMHKCQEKAKELSANVVVERILDKTEKRFLKNMELSPRFASRIDDYDKAISKLQLGTIQGKVSNDENLGEAMLGEAMLSFRKNGLGNVIQGLGVSQGLGIAYSFGTAHPQLNWVLSDLFDNDSNRVLGFLMLESCHTNRDPELFHSYLNNVLGYYSAKSSLWYRNMNWWTILEKAENSSINLMNILKEETSKIPNIKTTQRP